MSQSDTIADLLTCIRNAVRAKHRRLDVPASNVRKAIVEALQRENYIGNYKTIEDTKQHVLRIYLRYDMDDAPVITNLVKISKPGRRVYVGKDEVPRVLGGMGSAILSTTKGILTDKEARAAGLGGEVLAKIW
jgi:small subunit ribosomal protein S8